MSSTSSGGEIPTVVPTEIDSVKELLALVNGRRVLLIDARSALFFRSGHLPGALSLPRKSFTEAYPRLLSRLQQARNEDKQIVVYCQNSACEDGSVVAAALRAEGCRNVRVFTGGYQVWTAGGGAIERESR